MKRTYCILLITSLLFLISSCQKDKNKEPRIETLEITQGQNYTATVSGKISGLEVIALDFECGIEYSTSASFDKDSTWRVNTGKSYSEGIYTVTLPELKSQRDYYYRAYYINQLIINYGEIKQFNFFWERSDDFLIGMWTRGQWSYVFNSDHTGKRYLMHWDDVEQTFTWQLNGDEIEIKYEGTYSIVLADGQRRLVDDTAYIVYVFDSFYTLGFWVYDKNDPEKQLLSFIFPGITM